MEVIKNIHTFLNSHWEFSAIAFLLFNWLSYRQGFKQGVLTKSQEETR